MISVKENPNLIWFDELGTCRCGKPAIGIIRGPKNESYGYHCAKCAAKRLRDSEKICKYLYGEKSK